MSNQLSLSARSGRGRGPSRSDGRVRCSSPVVDIAGRLGEMRGPRRRASPPHARSPSFGRKRPDRRHRPGLCRPAAWRWRSRAMARCRSPASISIPTRIAELKRGHDRTGEVRASDLQALGDLALGGDPALLADQGIYIVTVPTPVDAAKNPDLGAAAGSLPIGRPGARARAVPAVLRSWFSRAPSIPA